MSWRVFVTDYFAFSRKERIGILFILPVLLLIFLFPDLSRILSKQDVIIQDTSWFSAIKRLDINFTGQTQESFDERNSIYLGDHTSGSFFTREKSETLLFHFDPNNLSEAGWQKLGIRDKTINTIQNYLNKGGRFYKPEDLQKIYGLRKNEFERLYPYIRIKRFDVTTREKMPENNQKEFSVPSRYALIDINTADTSSYISLPGIGGKLASRIINFREKLGGFYSIAQVGETYGIPDSTFQKIKQYLQLGDAQLKKININTASVDELRSHPYIKYSIANPIVAYRNEHGLFQSVSDLKKILVIDDQLYEKISRYLAVQ